MATVLGLAMKVTADASGLGASLSPVDKALADLGSKAESTASIFDRFRATTEGAANAQANVKGQFDQLAAALQAGEITAKQYAESFTAIQAAAQQTARIFEDGAKTIEKYRTAEENTAIAVDRLNEQLKAGAIDSATYERALADVTGENERAAKAEQEVNQFRERGRQILEQTRTPLERYDAQVAELRQHLEAGTITQETYDRALTKVSADFQKAEQAAKGYDKEAEKAGKGGALQFNELSGILSGIPGPIGNIAGRMSGLSSAAEGLGRVFSGGLSAGFGSITSALGLLANPIGLAIAGVAALGAAAAAIGSGLASLSTRVEELSNTASRLGTSFEFTQTLEEAAKRSGVSIETLAAGIQKFEVNIAKAREGGNETAAAFDRLGVSQAELRNSDPTELATKVAAALAKIEDPAERAALATTLLGKSGLELQPAFASIGEAEQAMDKFRTKLTDVDVSQLQQLDGIFDNIGTALQGLGTQLLLPFTGLTAGVATAIENAIAGLTRFIDPILDALTPVFNTLGDLIGSFSENWLAVGDVLGTTIGQAIENVVRVFNILQQAITSLIDYAGNLVSGFLEFTGLGGTVSSVASAIAGAFQGLWQGIKNVVSQVGGFIEQVLQFAEDWLGIDRGVQQANASYEEQRQIIQQTAEESEKKAKAEQEAARKAIEANTKIADSLLEQLEIEQKFGGDTSRFKAAQNVEAVEKEIARVREEVEKARAAGDKDSERAGMQRLQQLDQVQAQQEDIASGATAARKQAEEEQKRIDAEQKKRDEQRQKLLEDNSKKIAEAQKKYAEEVFKLEKKRVEDLRKLRLGALEIGDLRTASGASTFLDLASGKADPAIDEYRKQRKELEKLNENVRALRMEKAEILGGTG